MFLVPKVAGMVAGLFPPGLLGCRLTEHFDLLSQAIARSGSFDYSVLDDRDRIMAGGVAEASQKRDKNVAGAMLDDTRPLWDTDYGGC